MSLAVNNAIKEIGIEDDVVNRKISSGTEERTKIPEEKFVELMKNGLVINYLKGPDRPIIEYRRKRRASRTVDGDTVRLQVFK
jgi:hypothetical protein